MFPRHRSKFDSRVVREWSEPGGRDIDHTTRGARVTERGRERINAFGIRRRPRRSRAKAGSAFTLIELLVVMAIISVLLGLIAPAFNAINSGNDITSSAYMVKGVIEAARTYAKANDTYAWVGFYEEDTTATSPTNAVPAYPGVGRVVVATVFSKDGTKIYEDADPSAALPATQIGQLGKLIKIEGIHFTDIGAPTGGSSDTLDGRPNLPYTEGSPFDHFNRISSDSSDTTRFSFTAQNYTFYKTIRFSPRGEANINSTYTLKHEGEIGIRPTHGTTVDINTANLVAIQFSGVGGDVKIYRK